MLCTEISIETNAKPFETLVIAPRPDEEEMADLNNAICRRYRLSGIASTVIHVSIPLLAFIIEFAITKGDAGLFDTIDKNTAISLIKATFCSAVTSLLTIAAMNAYGNDLLQKITTKICKARAKTEFAKDVISSDQREPRHVLDAGRKAQEICNKYEGLPKGSALRFTLRAGKYSAIDQITEVNLDCNVIDKKGNIEKWATAVTVRRMDVNVNVPDKTLSYDPVEETFAISPATALETGFCAGIPIEWLERMTGGKP